jgi:hypothetical protein
MLSVSITIPQDVIDQGDVYVAMYGQETLPTSPPTTEYVYFDGTGFVAAEYGGSTSSVPAFARYTAAGTYAVSLPDTTLSGGEIVFGIGALPQIAIGSGNAPVQPTPGLVPQGTYDFVEISYASNGTTPSTYDVTVDTTMLDQFGFPIQLQLDPVDLGMPDGAGVHLDREGVFSAFQAYMAAHGSEFLQCARDPFGNPLANRILSPGDVLLYNTVPGVQAQPWAQDPGGSPSKLDAGTPYYYAVTALDAAGKESYGQPTVVQATPTAANPYVLVQWGTTPPGVPVWWTSCNVYRGTLAATSPPGVEWALVANVPGAGGGGCTDGGTNASTQPPSPIDPINPLANYLDAEIQAFFAAHTGSGSLVLTATDGTTDGCVYTLTGHTVSDAGQPLYLQLSVTDVTCLPGVTAPVATGTQFRVYCPFWNTNTFDPTLPPPPAAAGGATTVEMYSTTPATVMVLAAQGVFADSGYQPGVAAGAAATILGSVENQIVSAITRGIARTMAPAAWASQPIQTAPVPTSTPSTLPAGSYYYVVTSVTDGIESTPSLEFSAAPTSVVSPTSPPAEIVQSVEVTWMPTNGVDSFRVYRGTASQQENVLVAEVPNTSEPADYFLDTGVGTPDTHPPTYFPAGVAANVYDAFFHQPAVTLYGAAYASPYDDQGSQSSTLSGGSVTSVSITLGPWAPASPP